MSFNILYVENEDKHWDRLLRAVATFNEGMPTERLHIERARSPEEMNSKLDLRFDIILADVYYDDPRVEMNEIADGLDEIVGYVETWRMRQPQDRLLPIIAYTGRGGISLKRCLALKGRLYDIWDKNTASPEYVAWRLSKLAVDVSRGRPDAEMQRIIENMAGGARWHTHVKDMVQRYDAGWTERDQIERAGRAIEDIAYKLDIWDQCKPMWDIMKKWEWLARASSQGVRGHARHVINVFWMGYFVLHSQPLGNFFRRAWAQVLADRKDMGAVQSEKAQEALSDVWFLAGLFHDIGGCLEKSQALMNRQFDIVSPFLGSVDPPKIWIELLKNLEPELRLVSADFEPVLRSVLDDVITKGLEKGSVDHGLLAAMYLRRVVRGPRQACLAREAARAVALHNVFPTIDESMLTEFSWEKDPIACLLLLCDQLQTWDRERGDEALGDEDRPHRAELVEVSIANSRRPSIRMKIDYIAPSHVLRSNDLFEKIKDDLERVLKSNPAKALKKIPKPWPFDVLVECSLSREDLNTSITLQEHK